METECKFIALLNLFYNTYARPYAKTIMKFLALAPHINAFYKNKDFNRFINRPQGSFYEGVLKII